MEHHPPSGLPPAGIPDRAVFDKLLARLVLGGTYQQHADESCSATTMRARRNAWIRAGVFEQLHHLALGTYEQAVGLDLLRLGSDPRLVAELGRTPNITPKGTPYPRELSIRVGGRTMARRCG